VIVDDLELDPEDAAAVLELLPEAATVVATTPGVPIRGAKVVPVGGLPEDAACAYVARLLGQDLDERGAAGVAAVAGAVGGYPLRLRQALALARGSPVGLTAIAESLAGEDDRALARQALGALSEPEQRVVASVALPHRAPVHARHLSALCGVADAEEIARRLAGAGIIVADGNGVRLADDVAAEVEASWPLGTPRAVALGYMTGWAESNRRSPEAVAEESRALVGLAHWAVGAERHRETLRLAWAAESSLALAGAWGDWGRLLDAALRAAQVLGDRSAESWAVHEQGVRSLCLDDAPAARELLGRALSLRDQAGDDEAAEATRQVLATAPAGRGRRTARTAGGGRRIGTGGGGPRLPADARARLLLVAATIAIAAIVVAIVVATRGGDDETATETTPAPATPPPSPPETDTVLPPVVPSEPETVVEPPPTPPGGRIPANVRVAGPPIQEGSTGQRVRQLQRGLRALGYEPGTIDGAYGPATRQAIIEFQEDNQIEADGIAGRATLRAVNARLQELRDQAAAGTG
jgi:hypothetical protein